MRPLFFVKFMIISLCLFIILSYTHKAFAQSQSDEIDDTELFAELDESLENNNESAPDILVNNAENTDDNTDELLDSSLSDATDLPGIQDDIDDFTIENDDDDLESEFDDEFDDLLSD